MTRSRLVAIVLAALSPFAGCGSSDLDLDVPISYAPLPQGCSITMKGVPDAPWLVTANQRSTKQRLLAAKSVVTGSCPKAYIKSLPLPILNGDFFPRDNSGVLLDPDFHEINVEGNTSVQKLKEQDVPSGGYGMVLYPRQMELKDGQLFYFAADTTTSMPNSHLQFGLKGRMYLFGWGNYVVDVDVEGPPYSY